jgi:Ca2+-transporting ATPase
MSNTSGLTDQEVLLARAQFGSNVLNSEKPPSPLKRIFGFAKEPMFLLLIAAGLVSLFLAEPIDAAVLLLMVVIVISTTVYQEGRAEKALEALKSIAAPQANVYRAGELRQVASSELVVGDIVVLAEGDRVPADLQVLECSNLMLDESTLTGESLPVEKEAAGLLGSGSMVVSGRAITKVSAVGEATELGKISVGLAGQGVERTRLQTEVNKIVKLVAIGAVAIAIGITITLLLTRDSLVEALLAGIASAMAMIPEEFPVVLTLFFAIGAWRMTKDKVLTRKSAAIETLGSVTVICVDKTGTLTMNKLDVDQLIQAKGATELEFFAGLASPEDSADPVDKAFHSLATDSKYTLIKEYPLDPDWAAMTMVWEAEDHYVVATKGAPEVVAQMAGESAAEISKAVHEAAVGGRRIIGVAGTRIPKGALPKSQKDFQLAFQGLVALRDMLRPGVKDAIAECHAAGIRVIMITGDFIGTAREIASEVGLADTGELTGAELDLLSDEELAERVKTLSVCARMTPSHKLRLVKALRNSQEVVAMTGDGVNDAPALKLADISIAMGLRGTDVAREASKLIITDDDFSSIVAGVRRGRGIYDGIRKSVAYIIAVHVPLLGMAILPIAWPAWPLILLPAMVAFLETIIDPACTIVFQAEPLDPKIMKRKPRPVNQSLFSFDTLGIALLQGAGVLAVVIVQYFWLISQGRPEEEVRSVTLILMVLSNLFLILTNRSWSLNLVATLIQRRNPSVYWISSITIAIILLVLSIPGLREAFGLGTTQPTDWLLAFGLAAASVVWFEIYKFGLKRRGVLVNLTHD